VLRYPKRPDAREWGSLSHKEIDAKGNSEGEEDCLVKRGKVQGLKGSRNCGFLKGSGKKGRTAGDKEATRSTKDTQLGNGSRLESFDWEKNRKCGKLAKKQTKRRPQGKKGLVPEGSTKKSIYRNRFPL